MALLTEKVWREGFGKRNGQAYLHAILCAQVACLGAQRALQLRAFAGEWPPDQLMIQPITE